MKEHPQHTTHKHARCLPKLLHFFGQKFPQQDNPLCAELYAKFVLILFKPWLNVSDLKTHNTSWSAAWNEWCLSTESPVSQWTHQFLSNIMYMYEGEDECKKLREWHEKQAEEEHYKQMLANTTQFLLQPELEEDPTGLFISSHTCTYTQTTHMCSFFTRLYEKV